MEQRVCPEQVLALLTAWWRAFWVWNAIHYTLGLTATIGTVSIAANTSTAYDHQSLGVVVAICTAIITFSKASDKANAYIRAWRIVNTARIVYEVNPVSDNKELLYAVKKAEEIIGKAD